MRIFRKRGQNIMNGKAPRVTDKRKSGSTAYGESDDYVLFGDYQICFQTYADLYNLVKPDSGKIARAREVMEYQMSTAKNDYWWWADGLIHGNARYDKDVQADRQSVISGETA